MGKDDTKKTSAEKVDRVYKALQKFADMMIQRMEEIQKDWKKGWTDGFGGGGLPQNLSGRPYVGSNAFLLYLHTSMRHFTAPVYLTIKQIREAGAKIKKGEGSVPVFKWGFSIKDENGKKVSETDYKAMSKEDQAKCSVRPYLKVYNEWNIDQTNLAEVNREKYDAIQNKFKPEVLQDESGMYKNAALDRMFERQEWVCPIDYKQVVPGAYYSPSYDKVVIPRKSQFKISTTPEDIYKDGMEYYGTAIHEMAHSTGHKDRLNRLDNGRFGSPKYAKEELVAELTAALVGTSLGFDNRIRDNNAAYLKSWMTTLRQEPKFIVSVMSDVNKASKMILENIDKQRIALGEKALLDGNLDGEEERIKNEKDMEATKDQSEKDYYYLCKKIVEPSEVEEIKKLYNEGSYDSLIGYGPIYDDRIGLGSMNENSYPLLEQEKIYKNDNPDISGKILAEEEDYAIILSGDVCNVVRKYTKQEILNSINIQELEMKATEDVFKLAIEMKHVSETNAKMPNLVSIQENILKMKYEIAAKQFSRLLSEGHNNRYFFDMPNGEHLYLQYNQETNKIEVGHDTKDDIKVEHVFDYDLNNTAFTNTYNLYEKLAELPEYKAAEGRVASDIIQDQFIEIKEVLSKHAETYNRQDKTNTITSEYGDISKFFDEKIGTGLRMPNGKIYDFNYDPETEKIKVGYHCLGMKSLNLEVYNQAYDRSKTIAENITDIYNKMAAMKDNNDFTYMKDYVESMQDNNKYISGDENYLPFHTVAVELLIRAQKKGEIYRDVSQNNCPDEKDQYKKLLNEANNAYSDYYKELERVVNAYKNSQSIHQDSNINLDGEEECIKNEKDMEVTTKKTEDNNVKQVVYQQAENMSTKGSSDAESRKESSYIQAYVESMTDKENIMSGNYELLPSESKAGKLSQEVLRLSKEYDNYIKNPSEYDYEDRAELFADIEASNLALCGELLKQIESFRKLSPSIHEDSNIQTDVASKAKQIAATGVPIGEAEKKAKNIVNEEVNDDENKKAELSEEEKKRKGEIKLNDEHNKKKEVEQQAEQEKPDPVIKATAHALLIVSALQTAQKNNGIWMNKDSKPGAEIINSQTPVTAYNSIMMNLNSESNGYRTNLYSYYNSAKANGMPVKRNQSALPFSWTDWDYQSRSDEKVIISKQEYDKLPEAEKGLYVKHASHVMQNIYNIDQTTMSATNKDAYSAILKLKGAKEEPKESSLESNIKFVETFKKDNPEVLLLVKADNYYKAYKEDAEKVSEVLDLELTRSNKIKEEDGKGLRTAKFSREMLDFNLPKLIRAGNRVAISDARDLRLKNNSEEADKIVNAAIDCAKNIASKVGIKIHRSGISPNINYEPNVDRMLITSKKLSPQSTYSESIDRSCNIYRCLVQAVGRENRLDRIGRSQNLPLKAEVYDSLIQELAAGAMMARKGLPAKIARENIDYIPVWTKALNDNPKLVRVVEKDINTTIETLDKIGLGQDVDFAAIRGEKPLIATPQHKPVDIVKFQAIKDEVGHYAFFIKPKNEPSFCVYPKREHLSTFFSVLKSDKRDETHKALATKYYDLATKYPDMKKDLITPRKVDYDTSVITSASITSSAQDSKIKLLFATINGKRETAVITPSQWQKMWLADDMGAYKKALAADVFESLIKKEIKQDNNEDVEKAQTISRHR